MSSALAGKRTPVLVGAMNHPGRPVEEELVRIAELGFDFVDLTLEPPGAWPGDGATIARVLQDTGLSVVGHTAWYLPIASPFPDLREQALAIFRSAFDTFAASGATLVNVHPDPATRVIPLDELRKRNAESIAELADEAERHGLTLMVENLGRSFGRVEDLHPILAASPSLAFHLDIGHAHLARGVGEPNRTEELLAAFGDRLAHVHASDNLGDEDLHLPLGVGTIDWPAAIRALKASGWDGTVTLEVFAAERSYLELSRRLWLDWWAAS